MADVGRRVLLVDDDDDVRRAVCEVLTDEGYEVREATNGRDAMAMLGEWEPDAILLDLLMPEMDGWTFLAEQQEHPTLGRIPVIVMSGRHNLRDRELPAADVLAKPFILTRLLDTLERVAR